MGSIYRGEAGSKYFFHICLKSMVSCQKGPTCHAYAWQIGPFWHDTIDIWKLSWVIAVPANVLSLHFQDSSRNYWLKWQCHILFTQNLPSVSSPCRIRPQSAQERLDMCQICTTVSPSEPQVFMGKDKAFTYDHVFNMDSLQDALYADLAKPLIDG